MDLKEKLNLHSFNNEEKGIKVIDVDKAIEISKKFIKDAVIKERIEWGDRIAGIGRMYIQKTNKQIDELVLEITELQREIRDIDVPLMETGTEIYSTVV